MCSCGLVKYKHLYVKKEQRLEKSQTSIHGQTNMLQLTEYEKQFGVSAFYK